MTPNTLRVQYLENSYTGDLETIANYNVDNLLWVSTIAYPSDSFASYYNKYIT